MPVRVVDLRREGGVDPIGVGSPTPRLSWRLAAGAGETDVEQVAARVTVGKAGSDDVVWDSGRIEGWRMQLRYGGPPLASRARCWWRVRVWTTDSAGALAPSEAVSDDARFELGLLAAGDWAARMIRPASDVASAAVRFTTEVDVAPGAVRAARLHLTAHGIAVPLLNGEEVTDEVLLPGWTSYRRRLAVRTIDVTARLRDGRNELAVVVAPGWFSGRLGFRNERAVYGEQVGVLAQLEVEHDDGHRTEVATNDAAWHAEPTPWLEADLYDGETYDACTERASGGVPVEVVDLDLDDVLVAPPVPPARRTEVRRPVDVSRIDGGTTLAVDVGQNVVGWLRLKIDGVAPGTEVVARHAEVLDGDGRLFTAPLRSARATDRYVAFGTGPETYEPRFTFHGFRYAEVSGLPATATVDIEAVVVHSDLERTGTFTCSDPLVDRLHENVVWGWRGNSVSVPTDCPQRDERLGWTGDAQVFAPTVAYLYDCQAFFESWLADLRVDQRDGGAVPHVVPDTGAPDFAGAAGWGDAAVVVPWVLYEAYGDETVLRDALPSMVAWVDYVHARLDDGIWTQDFQFGDWLDPDAPIDQPWRAKARFDLVATAYAARACDLLGRAAAVLGEHAVAGVNAGRFAALRETWWAKFGGEAVTTQTGCALALEFDLVPPKDAAARRRLGDGLAALVHEAGDHLATGFLGTPLLLPALTAAGHLDAAYAVLLQRSAPSWLYQVLAGATTVWERWEALRPDGSVPLDALGGGSGGSMVSFNHYAYGCVADWLHRTVLGIAPDAEDPGYHHVIVAPRPGGGISRAAGSLTTRFGPVSVDWRVVDGEMRLDVEVPPNARATAHLPGGDPVTLGSGTWSLPR